MMDKFLRVTLKARGVRDTLKGGTGAKGVQTPEVILFSQPRETVILVCIKNILEVSQIRLPRQAVKQRGKKWGTE